MKKKISFALFAIPVVFVLPLLALGSLPAPQGFSAAVVGNDIQTSWEPVILPGTESDPVFAMKYSVNIVVEYDIKGERISVDFDFGTSDRTDGYSMSDPWLSIPLDELTLDIDDGMIPVGELPDLVSLQARVKALNPGKMKGNQDNPFSPLVSVAGLDMP